jgi:choline dehydrogenase-like flavoprotein
MSKAAKAIGLNPFIGPAAILSQTYDGRFACGYHGYCMSLGCHLGAKSSPAFSTIPAAQKTGKLDVVTEASVTRIEVDKDGRARCHYIKEDRSTFSRPTYCSYRHRLWKTRLLLHRNRLRFRMDLPIIGQVEHYFSHAQFGSVSAVFPFDLRNWYGTPGQGIC